MKRLFFIIFLLLITASIFAADDDITQYVAVRIGYGEEFHYGGLLFEGRLHRIGLSLGFDIYPVITLHPQDTGISATLKIFFADGEFSPWLGFGGGIINQSIIDDNSGGEFYWGGHILAGYSVLGAIDIGIGLVFSHKEDYQLLFGFNISVGWSSILKLW